MFCVVFDFLLWACTICSVFLRPQNSYEVFRTPTVYEQCMEAPYITYTINMIAQQLSINFDAVCRWHMAQGIQ